MTEQIFVFFLHTNVFFACTNPFFLVNSIEKPLIEVPLIVLSTVSRLSTVPPRNERQEITNKGATKSRHKSMIDRAGAGADAVAMTTAGVPGRRASVRRGPGRPLLEVGRWTSCYAQTSRSLFIHRRLLVCSIST